MSLLTEQEIKSRIFKEIQRSTGIVEGKLNSEQITKSNAMIVEGYERKRQEEQDPLGWGCVPYDGSEQKKRTDAEIARLGELLHRHMRLASYAVDRFIGTCEQNKDLEDLLSRIFTLAKRNADLDLFEAEIKFAQKEAEAKVYTKWGKEFGTPPCCDFRKEMVEKFSRIAKEYEEIIAYINKVFTANG